MAREVGRGRTERDRRVKSKSTDWLTATFQTQHYIATPHPAEIYRCFSPLYYPLIQNIKLISHYHCVINKKRSIICGNEAPFAMSRSSFMSSLTTLFLVCSSPDLLARERGRQKHLARKCQEFWLLATAYEGDIVHR